MFRADVADRWFTASKKEKRVRGLLFYRINSNPVYRIHVEEVERFAKPIKSYDIGEGSTLRLSAGESTIERR